jgi:SNF2 family DNA or RNA helicase
MMLGITKESNIKALLTQIEKRAASGTEGLLSNEDLKGLRKYTLAKDELQKPRELSPEEEDRLAFRRSKGWSWNNPALDTGKRDVFHHIQNPWYRSGLDALSNVPAGVMHGATLGAYMGGLSGRTLGHTGVGAAVGGTIGGLRHVLSAKQQYDRQKLYNEIAEQYIRHHNEGAVESMPTVIKEMTHRRKGVNNLQVNKKKIKEAAFGLDPETLGKFIKPETLQRVQESMKVPKNLFLAGMLGVQTLGAVGLHRHNRKDIDDIKERFERKLKDKAEADLFVSKVRMPLYRKSLGHDEKIQNFEDLFKTSADKPDESPLLPHQQRVIDRLKKDDQPGLILMHGLGSGKTRSSIEAYKNLGMPAEVLLPAALKENYQKELHKWLGNEPKNVHIRSQQEAARKGVNPEDFKDKLMIIDEAHRLRNEDTKLYKNLKEVQPKKRLLLTGTPIYNHPSDIAKLINMAAGKQIMPERQADFEKEYIAQKTVFPTIAHRLLGIKPGQELSVKNKDYLRAVFGKLIDYHAGNAEGFPTVDKETVRVPMAEKQQQIYKAMMKELPWHMRAKVTAGLPPDRKELDKLIPFLSGARMISNSTSGFDKDEAGVVSPKIEQAFKYLKGKIDEDPSYKGLIYSNYLKSGVDPYKKLLQGANIPYGEFTGDIKDTVRNQLVKDYNANKLKALIVSSAGGEGLDLKGTRLVQLLEPHFNNEKIKQVIGRAARYRSHEGLDPEKQKVLVQNYLSSVNPSVLEKLRRKNPTSTDEYMQNLSDEKEKLNNEFIKLIKGDK